jgi:hypothetical protein
MKWQLAGTWLISSLVTGTIAVLATADRGNLPFRPLALYPGSAMFTLFVLVGALFLALLALGWRTEDATWLPNQPRAAILWTILVGGGGLAGWAFAAAVTFDSEFSLTAQLILAYVAGGLPFTLVAAMLLRPSRVNLAAAVVTVVALGTGWLLMTAPVESLLFYLQQLFGPVVIVR